MEPENPKTVYLMGLFVLLGGLILSALVIRFGSLSDVWHGTYEITVQFKNASTLTQGSVVRLGGQKIGSVAAPPSLLKDLSGVNVVVAVEEGIQLPEGSAFQIASNGVMGDAFIQVVPPEKLTDAFIPRGEIVPGAPPVDLMASAEGIAIKTTELMAQIQSGVEDLTTAVNRINTGILGDQNLDNFNKLLTEARTAAENVNQRFLTEDNGRVLSEGLASLNKAAASMEEQADNLSDMMADLKPAVTGAKDALAEAKGTFSAATKTIRKVGDFTDQLDQTGNTIASLKQSFDGLKETLNAFYSGSGLMTALLKDEKLREDFKDLVFNLKEKGVLFYRDVSDKAPRETRPRSARLPRVLAP